MRISEVELLPNYGSSGTYRHEDVLDKKNPLARSIARGDFRLVTRIKGHSIYYQHVENRWKDSLFIAVNDDTNLIDMRLDGTARRRHGMVMFNIENLDGRPDSNLKAYEFYHAILAKAPVIFITNMQSYGGLRTWQELAKYPDMEVFGWNKGKPVNVTPLEPEDTHISYDDALEEPGGREILGMKLVAHKKLDKKHGA